MLLVFFAWQETKKRKIRVHEAQKRDNMKKDILEKSFRDLDNKVKMKVASYKNMKSTLRKVERELKNGGFTFSSKRIGGAKLRLGVNYSDKAYDVDSALIFNGQTKEELVETKFAIVKFLNEKLSDEYENLKVKNSKPVVTLKFKTKNGVDKFHLDLLIVSKIDDVEYFAYSKKPNEKGRYELVETEFRKMTDDFHKILIESENEFDGEKRTAIRVLKYWNSYVNQSSKGTKIPSSVFTELISFSEEHTVISLIKQTLVTIKEQLSSGGFESTYIPNWNYFRKIMKKNDKLQTTQQNVNNVLNAINSSLDEKIGVEESIKILKVYFDGIMAPIDQGAQGEASPGRAG